MLLHMRTLIWIFTGRKYNKVGFAATAGIQTFTLKYFNIVGRNVQRIMYLWPVKRTKKFPARKAFPIMGSMAQTAG